jgi:hypothetical protein
MRLQMRETIEAEIERLIGLLDQVDGDPDFESSGDDEDDGTGEDSLGWAEMEARFGHYGDAGDDREIDDSDDEPSLGACEPYFELPAWRPMFDSNAPLIASAWPRGSQERWAAGRRDDCELDQTDDEASVGFDVGELDDSDDECTLGWGEAESAVGLLSGPMTWPCDDGEAEDELGWAEDEAARGAYAGASRELENEECRSIGSSCAESSPGGVPIIPKAARPPVRSPGVPSLGPVLLLRCAYVAAGR